MNLKESQGRLYGRVQREERGGANDVIIVSKNKRCSYNNLFILTYIFN